ncbi:MAG: hypothetical protein ACK53A_02935 [Gemmatimonadota bacterium]|nr:hypothetical protein [Gemmatimonadota bacterium]
MTPVLKYSVVSVALVGATAVLFAVAYGAPEARLGIGIAALVAVVLQPAMFVVARGFKGPQFMVGWGIGALACGVALLATGLALRAAGLPTDAPMLALATSLFLTELVEPLLLTQS